MEIAFTWLSQSKNRTHSVAMVTSAFLFACLVATIGTTKFALALAVPIWFLVDGMLLALAASYADPDDERQFSAKDMLIGSMAACAAILLFLGAIVYKLMFG